TWVDPATPSEAPTAVVLAVAVSARACTTTPQGEGTVSRELRTPPLPATHVPLGYDGQNRRCQLSVTIPPATPSRTPTKQRKGRGLAGVEVWKQGDGPGAGAAVGYSSWPLRIGHT